ISGHVPRRVQSVGPVALSHVTRIHTDRAKSRPEMALSPGERPMVRPQSTQEDESILSSPKLFIIERATLNVDRGHVQTETAADYGTTMRCADHPLMGDLRPA